MLHLFGCGLAKHGCGVARLLACRTAVRQSQVQFLTWHPHGSLSALSRTCDEETQRDFNEWRRMYVKKYECTVGSNRLEQSYLIAILKYLK
jgi:hypothetical protein